MKKILALAALGLVLTYGIASAGRQSPKWIPDALTLRTTQPNSGTVGTTLDSGVVRNGSATAQTTYDTTVAFPLAKCELNSIFVGGITGAAVDTLPQFMLAFYPTANTNFTPGFDSLLVQTQLSFDGANWVDATPTRAFDATRTAGNAAGMILIENFAAANGVSFIFNQGYSATGQVLTSLGTATAPTTYQTFGYNYIRFILGDCGYTGEFAPTLWHWSFDDP
jgi:hypothetical protein